VLVARIVGRLAELKKLLAEGPLQLLEDMITPWLQPMASSKSLVDRAARALGTDSSDWRPSERARQLAKALLSGGLDSIAQAMAIVAPQIGEANANQLAHALAPTWVDPEVAAPILEIVRRPPKQRGVAVNGERPFTGETYVARAAAKYPSWKVLEVTLAENTGAEDQAGAIIGQIRAAYRARLRRDDLSTKDIDRRLKTFKDDNPHFVLLVGKLRDGVLDDLREMYPLVTFFRLTGDAFPDVEELRRQYVDFLAPGLPPGVEDDVWDLYMDTLAVISEAYSNPTNAVRMSP
jgi:hypothetical protein